MDKWLDPFQRAVPKYLSIPKHHVSEIGPWDPYITSIPQWLEYMQNWDCRRIQTPKFLALISRKTSVLRLYMGYFEFWLNMVVCPRVFYAFPIHKNQHKRIKAGFN